MTNNGNGYREALQDDESLAAFLKAMGQFDRRFCEAMTEGTDYTIRLEVHGCKGELIHARVVADGFERPRSREVRELRAKKMRKPLLD